MNTTRFNVKKMVLAALMLALCMVLPFLTGQIPQIGSALLPMHFPVLLCGFVCGGPWGAAVGFVAPLLRYLLFLIVYLGAVFVYAQTKYTRAKKEIKGYNRHLKRLIGSFERDGGES